MAKPDPEVLRIQQFLNAQGYNLEPDGIWGPVTHAAYTDYEDRTKPDEPTVAPPPARPWYLNSTLLGLIASAAAMLANRRGWLIDSDQLAQILTQGVEYGGLVLAFIGRLRDQAPIDPRLAVPAAGPRLAQLQRPELSPRPGYGPQPVARSHPDGADPQGGFPTGPFWD